MLSTPHELRLREAIECFKRALISADPHEITIHLKLAKIHRTLEEYAESAAYHRGVVEVCQADCKQKFRAYFAITLLTLPSQYVQFKIMPNQFWRLQSTR